MIRIGTTPRHEFSFPLDVEMIKQLKVTYEQGGKIVLTKYLADCERYGNKVYYYLSQQETFLFDENENVSVQVRALTFGGEVLSSRKIITSAYECLDKEVLE